MARVPEEDLEDYDLEEAERKFDNLVAERNGHGSSSGIPTADHDVADRDVTDVPWMHVQDSADPDVSDPDEPHVDTDDLLDGFIDAFNERDLEGILDLMGAACEMPGLAHAEADPNEALTDLWVRRPTCQLTRGHLDDEDAAVLWEVGDNAGWWPQAVVRVEVGTDGDAAEVVFDDAPDLIDRVEAPPPEGRLDEGADWAEWESGVLDG